MNVHLDFSNQCQFEDLQGMCPILIYYKKFSADFPQTELKKVLF